jgi:hypothetical protein
MGKGRYPFGKIAFEYPDSRGGRDEKAAYLNFSIFFS